MKAHLPREQKSRANTVMASTKYDTVDDAAEAHDMNASTLSQWRTQGIEGKLSLNRDEQLALAKRYRGRARLKLASLSSTGQNRGTRAHAPSAGAIKRMRAGTDTPRREKTAETGETAGPAPMRMTQTGETQTREIPSREALARTASPARNPAPGAPEKGNIRIRTASGYTITVSAGADMRRVAALVRELEPNRPG